MSLNPYYLALLIISTPAWADTQIDYGTMQDNCVKSASRSTNGFMQTAVLTECAEVTSKEAKKEINSLYKKLYGELSVKSSTDAAKLEQSQKSWVIYRNQHCELAAEYVGSPMSAVCPMHLNISRVNELRELLGK